MSAAMVASEAAARTLQASLDESEAARAECDDKLKDAAAQRDEAEKELAETRDELAAILKKLEACQDECAELTAENRDVKLSNDRLDRWGVTKAPQGFSFFRVGTARQVRRTNTIHAFLF